MTWHATGRGTAGRVVLVVAALALVATTNLQASAAVPNAPAPTPGYLTLMFGRTQWASVDGSCRQYPNAVSLDSVAQMLGQLGLRGSGTVVVNRTAEDGPTCYNRYYLSPGWDNLAMLRDTYGWSFVSDGITHQDITLMEPEDQWAESCGSLAEFEEHGHTGAWGLFAYGNNRFSLDVQRSVVSTCFAYGRTYRGGVNTRSTLVAPWLQRTVSVNGGRCNDLSKPCATIANKFRYANPAQLASLMRVAQNSWVVIQMYRLVTGSRLAATGQRWDCTSPDWRAHWSSDEEIYCLGDYMSAVKQIPRTVVVTDPATVATAWGRIP